MPQRGILCFNRLLDLKGAATRFKKRNISATIVADVKRFGQQIKRTRFSAHTGPVCSRHQLQALFVKAVDPTLVPAQNYPPW
jgi:hypothetical protein